MKNSNRVIHFEIQADDIERAKEFYKKVFGWKIKMMMEKVDDETPEYWGVTTGPDTSPGINGGMYERPIDHKLHTFDCTISVPDIDKAIQAIKSCGGIIRKDKTKIPGVGWSHSLQCRR